MPTPTPVVLADETCVTVGEAVLVAQLRWLRLLGGGYRARQEWRRMLRDRQSAQIEARAALAKAMVSGEGVLALRRLAEIYRRRLHATRARLSAS